jgi:uncharacterized repeat protein (TIGR03803 family)
VSVIRRGAGIKVSLERPFYLIFNFAFLLIQLVFSTTITCFSYAIFIPLLPPPRTNVLNLRQVSPSHSAKSLIFGGFLALSSSLLTLTSAMATGIQSLASFDGANGAEPFVALTQGTDGLFYGTTLFGGSLGAGNIFSFNPVGNVLTSLASFDGANGAEPFAALTQGTDGLFYGTTFSGGSSGLGTIFSFDPNPSTSVPEPSTLLGASIAITLGGVLKRKPTRKSAK